jgi:hypothetical protein
MSNKENKSGHPNKPQNIENRNSLSYPPGDDIYEQSKEEQDIDPEDTSKSKSPNADDQYGEENELDFDEDVSGRDLDVPGSELDDMQEDNGNEDEENNSYSLGGDEHNDLEEDKGD